MQQRTRINCYVISAFDYTTYDRYLLLNYNEKKGEGKAYFFLLYYYTYKIHRHQDKKYITIFDKKIRQNGGG